ncbi:virion morphogenesis protein [Escherichia coli]|nr:virion morphogenesis protein [Escherichia coli]
MSELTALQERLAGLIASLSPAARRQMAVEVAKSCVPVSNSVSSASRYRRHPVCGTKAPAGAGKKGRIKREMFAKLRTSRFMKAKGSDSAAVVEFTGKVQRMARVHQYGLKDRPNRNSRDVQYEARPLLGYSSSDLQKVESLIMDALCQRH